MSDILALRRLPMPVLTRGRQKLERLFQRVILNLINSGISVRPGTSKHLRYEFFTDIQEDLVKQGKQGFIYKCLLDLAVPKSCRTGLPLFIHVPRCAGVSVSLALYGKHRDHHTAQYFKKLDPVFYASVNTFAIVRDPVARTLSAFSFVVNQGGNDMPLSRSWSARTRDIQTLDHYLDFLEENASQLDKLDFVMRSQSAFICDQAGQLIVDQVFCLERDMARLNQYLYGFHIPVLSIANANKGVMPSATAKQVDRIRALYRHDVALYREAWNPGELDGF